MFRFNTPIKTWNHSKQEQLPQVVASAQVSLNANTFQSNPGYFQGINFELSFFQ